MNYYVYIKVKSRSRKVEVIINLEATSLRQIAYRRAPSTTRFAFFYEIPRLKNFVASCDARGVVR